jgi:hypothetical protein
LTPLYRIRFSRSVKCEHRDFSETGERELFTIWWIVESPLAFSASARRGAPDMGSEKGVRSMKMEKVPTVLNSVQAGKAV